MEIFRLICFEWHSYERAKYIWEDFGGSSTWDEVIGRMYLLKALDLLQAQLALHPNDDCLRFTLATCLLHLERYDEAVAAYEQADFKAHSEGLEAARCQQQPDWDNL